MVCEWCVSCNYFDFDEDENSGEDQERTTDRMFVIPYEQPGLLSIAEVNRLGRGMEGRHEECSQVIVSMQGKSDRIVEN